MAATGESSKSTLHVAADPLREKHMMAMMVDSNGVVAQASEDEAGVDDRRRVVRAVGSGVTDMRDQAETPGGDSGVHGASESRHSSTAQEASAKLDAHARFVEHVEKIRSRVQSLKEGDVHPSYPAAAGRAKTIRHHESVARDHAGAELVDRRSESAQEGRINVVPVAPAAAVPAAIAAPPAAAAAATAPVAPTAAPADSDSSQYLFLLTLMVCVMIAALGSFWYFSMSGKEEQKGPRVQWTGHMELEVNVAVDNGDRDLLRRLLQDAEMEGISLPYTPSEYEKQLEDTKNRCEFMQQLNERRRVNWSLNGWNRVTQQLELRTLFECSIADIFPSEHAEAVFKNIAQTLAEDGQLSDASDDEKQMRHPFVSVPNINLKRFVDQLMNKGSGLAAEGSLRWDMGLPVTSEKYVLGVTFEKINLTSANQKFRVLIIREDLLHHTKSKKPSEVHNNPYFQYRWKTLQQLHDLYFEQPTWVQSRKVEPRRIRDALLILDPGKPLMLSMSGVPDRPIRKDAAPWDDPISDGPRGR